MKLYIPALLLLLLLYGPLACPAAVAQEEQAEASAQQAQDPYAFKGVTDFEEAIRTRMTTAGFRDLNKVVDLLGSARDMGLCQEDDGFAALMLSDALMERATSLARVINTQSLLSTDERMREQVLKVRHLVESDLRRVLAGPDPPNSARLLLGKVAALPGGDPHEARRMLTTFLDSEDLTDQQRAEAYGLRAHLHSTPEQALADFDRAVELDPENTAYRLKRALYHQSRQEFDEALKDADSVIELTPEDASAYIIRGESLRQLQRLDEAVAAFDRATELAPRSPRPYQHRGEIFRNQGKLDEAIEQFSKVLQFQPGVMSTLIQRAEVYLRAGKFDEALADADLVIDKQPDLFTPLAVAAHRIRCEVLASTDRLDEAISEIERISVAVPDQVELKMQLALYLMFNERPDKAIEAYSEVIETDPQNFVALRSRGDAYLNVGSHEEAVADFSKALQLRPDDTAVLNNLAWVLATSPEDGVRDGKRGLALATRACEITEYKLPHILSTLAACYAETGDFEQAIQWSKKAVELEEAENGESLPDLKNELNSYEEGKPWRERQTMQPQPDEPLPEGDTVPTDVQLPL